MRPLPLVFPALCGTEYFPAYAGSGVPICFLCSAFLSWKQTLCTLIPGSVVATTQFSDQPALPTVFQKHGSGNIFLMCKRSGVQIWRKCFNTTIFLSLSYLLDCFFKQVDQPTVSSFWSMNQLTNQPMTSVLLWKRKCWKSKLIEYALHHRSLMILNAIL